MTTTEGKRIGVGDFKTTNKMRDLVGEVLDSGRLSYGPKCKELERRFASDHGRRYGVLSNSGTSSLQVALQALKRLHGWEDGDEVLIPSVTFVATANIVLHNNMKPVLVDVDPDTYNMNPYLVEGAITDRTRAIIPVHLFGQSADIMRMKPTLTSKNILMVEDSCESMYVTHHGEPVGSMGMVGCFSFYVAHLLTTGVGGIAITSNENLATVMRSLVNHGRDGIYFDMDTDIDREVISRRFNFWMPGHSFRITELEAAIGLAQLDSMEFMIQERLSNALYLTRGLQDYQDRIQLPRIAEGNTHSFMMYPIIMHGGNKLDFTTFLESKGIETRDMLPLTNQKVYEGLWDESGYPVAKWINDYGFYIGCHQYLEPEDLEYMIDVIGEYLD